MKLITEDDMSDGNKRDISELKRLTLSELAGRAEELGDLEESILALLDIAVLAEAHGLSNWDDGWVRIMRPIKR
jgi:hypothetical protein